MTECYIQLQHRTQPLTGAGIRSASYILCLVKEKKVQQHFIRCMPKTTDARVTGIYLVGDTPCTLLSHSYNHGS